MIINRASPVELRKALEAAQAMVKAGILFIPIPVMTNKQIAVAAVIGEQHFNEIEEILEADK